MDIMLNDRIVKIESGQFKGRWKGIINNMFFFNATKEMLMIEFKLTEEQWNKIPVGLL